MAAAHLLIVVCLRWQLDEHFNWPKLAILVHQLMENTILPGRAPMVKISSNKMIFTVMPITLSTRQSGIGKDIYRWGYKRGLFMMEIMIIEKKSGICPSEKRRFIRFVCVASWKKKIVGSTSPMVKIFVLIWLFSE